MYCKFCDLSALYQYNGMVTIGTKLIVPFWGSFHLKGHRSKCIYHMKSVMEDNIPTCSENINLNWKKRWATVFSE